VMSKVSLSDTSRNELRGVRFKCGVWEPELLEFHEFSTSTSRG